MNCITGAGGTVGSEVVKQLESAQVPFRVAHFSKEKAEAARARGLEAVIIDYNRPETFRTAFQECDKLFLLGPNALNQSELEPSCRVRSRLLASSRIFLSLAESDVSP